MEFQTDGIKSGIGARSKNVPPPELGTCVEMPLAHPQIRTVLPLSSSLPAKCHSKMADTKFRGRTYNGIWSTTNTVPVLFAEYFTCSTPFQTAPLWIRIHRQAALTKKRDQKDAKSKKKRQWIVSLLKMGNKLQTRFASKVLTVGPESD